MPKDREVIRHAAAPFVRLSKGRLVMANFEIVLRKARDKWSRDEEIARFTSLTLDGREFEVISTDERAYVPIDERRAFTWMEPLRARAVGGCFTVTYHRYAMSHYGSLSGNVTLEIDPAAMTIRVVKDLEYEDA